MAIIIRLLLEKQFTFMTLSLASLAASWLAYIYFKLSILLKNLSRKISSKTSLGIP